MKLYQQSEEGLTLLGLLCSLLIISIVSSFSARIGKNAIEKRAITKLGSKIKHSLELGYEFSQYSKQNINALLGANKNEFIIRSNNKILLSLPLAVSPQTTLNIFSGTTSNSGDQKTLRFLPNGYSSPGRIEIKSTHYWCDIKVSLRGRVVKRCGEARI